MTHPDPQELLRHALDRGATPATARCLDDDTMAALVDGALDGDARERAIEHLAECARCRIAVGSVARAVADPAVARELPPSAAGRRRLLQVALPAAAAAVVLFVAVPWRSEDGAGSHRAPTITAVSAPVPMFPAGIVAAAETLRWTTMGAADRYRATLFNDQGAVVYETQTVDTIVSLPDSVHLAPGRSYLWKVEARTGWGRWSTSPLIEFSIR